MSSADNPRVIQAQEASRLERDLAMEALSSGDRESAWNHLYQALVRLSSHQEDAECKGLFVSTSLELSNVSFVLGKGFSNLIMFLQNALKLAAQLGDRRSQAMINLHLGRLYYFAEQREKALDAFKQGIQVVESIGDEDIITQASEFIGLFYFMQGFFLEAQPYFERATQSFEAVEWGMVLNPSGPMWLSYCAAYRGQFHRAIGTLDYYRRLAMDKSDHALANTLRAVLGIILAMIKKNKEAAFHFGAALQEAKKTKNALAAYFATGGSAYQYSTEGRLDEAREWLARTVTEGAASGIVRQYASPFALEMLYEFHRYGLEPIPQLNFHRELQRLMLEPNVHLRGVALRLRAAEAAANEEENDFIESDLELSEDYLKRSGDPVQLGKTRLEMARLMLQKGDQEKARALAQKAWKGFSGYGDVFYPDDLRHLLTVKGDFSSDHDSREELLEMFMAMIEELVPSTDVEELFNRTVASTNRFFGAERGGIFWFRHRRTEKEPDLRAAYNLLETDVRAEDFNKNMALVLKAFRNKQPQVLCRSDKNPKPNEVKTILCIPFEVSGRVRGVLYHDNSYANDCFDRFDESQLVRIAQSLTKYIGEVIGFSRRIEKKVTRMQSQFGQTDTPEIIAQSPVMEKILDQADSVAVTSSTVLILGETGVGKELVARRIHQQSQRRNNPLVVVDPTAIPENLVESELFGHEKGAFTGAERQKRGRIEIAHRGTLFIDEVGEIPKSIQVKFLRSLQEKTMMRVGGTTTISTDFRLIAATNRDLAEEVAAGRFREDLFYRLNVIPIIVPPLRDRKDDIILLAHHFLNRYTAKYNRPMLKITSDDESKLLAYNWPGNVRELQNVMERAVLLSAGAQLNLDLPSQKKSFSSHPFIDIPTLDEVQRRYIRYILEKTGGKLSGVGGASELLGMKRSSLYNRMKKLGLH